ncbi:MAG TPA: hypothetical protein VH590_03485, partial [Ktedonobacterales bacterium]
MPRLEPSQVILRLSRLSRQQRAISVVLAWLARIGLCVGALFAVFSSPPLVDFQPALPPALALALVGALALLLPPVLPRVTRWRWLHVAIQIAGFFLLAAVIGWAALSQPIALNMPLALAESLRALPVVALAGLAALLLARLAWQRRALVALVLPTLLALSFIAIRTPPYVLDFRPYWLAVDGHGTLYVTDVESPVIRVFTPDGSLQAKLRPRIAARQGPPGIGFSPPGPWNDPDQLGVPSLTGGQSSAGWLRPWPANTDEFLFCGLAVDSQNR